MISNEPLIFTTELFIINDLWWCTNRCKKMRIQEDKKKRWMKKRRMWWWSWCISASFFHLFLSHSFHVWTSLHEWRPVYSDEQFPLLSEDNLFLIHSLEISLVVSTQPDNGVAFYVWIKWSILLYSTLSGTRWRKSFWLNLCLWWRT